MKKRSTSFTIAALTVGLCLAATQAFASAWDFRVINSSGGDLKVDCSTPINNITGPLLNGGTEDYFCDGTVLVQRVGGNPEYYLSNDCGSNEMKEITVTAGATDPELTLAPQCVPAAEE